METFKITMDAGINRLVFDICEQNRGSELIFEVVISEPKNIADLNEIKQPLTLVYDAASDQLRFESKHDLSFMRAIDIHLSEQIINRN